MRFRAIVRLQGIWPVSWLCTALEVTCAGFYAWLKRAPSARTQLDETLCRFDAASPYAIEPTALAAYAEICATEGIVAASIAYSD